MLYSTFVPFTSRLQRSRPPSPGRAVFVLWAPQGTGHQATVLLEQTCSYHSQRWFAGRYNPSLNQQLEFRASVHVFSLLKAWCSNWLSSCDSEMERGKRHSQYFRIFTPNVTQRAPQNRGREILMLVFGGGCLPLLSCLPKFLLLDLLDGIFQY